MARVRGLGFGPRHRQALQERQGPATPRATRSKMRCAAHDRCCVAASVDRGGDRERGSVHQRASDVKHTAKQGVSGLCGPTNVSVLGLGVPLAPTVDPVLPVQIPADDPFESAFPLLEVAPPTSAKNHGKTVSHRSARVGHRAHAPAASDHVDHVGRTLELLARSTLADANASTERLDLDPATTATELE